MRRLTPAPQRRIATLVAYTRLLAASARDDVIDIFDVVFGDLQRAATHRGQKRRAGELRDYDRAVAAVHARMRSLLDALDDPPTLEEVLEEFRTQRAGIEATMDTVQALMRPPGDPFHERLVAAYPQIRRFLPALIEALELQAIDSAAPVLDAYHALGQWLAGKPRTTRRPASEIPLGVVTPSWRPHVHDQQAGTVDRAAYTCCVLDQVRTRLRRRDIYAPGSTRWGDPRAELLTPHDWAGRRDTLCEELALDPDPATIAAQLAPAWMRRGGAPPPGTPSTPTCGSNTETAATRSCSPRWTPRSNPPRWSPCARVSRPCYRKWKSPTCPWRCTAGRYSWTSTPTSAAPRPARTAWPSRCRPSWSPNRATWA
ncbi:MAG: hypothetical protein ACRDNT_13605 [Streptosporangiaceae bacterium]